MECAVMLLTPTISESVSLLVSIVTCTPKQALVKDFVKVIVVLEFLPQYVFPHFKINVPICIPPFVPLFEKLVIAKPASLEACGDYNWSKHLQRELCKNFECRGFHASAFLLV